MPGAVDPAAGQPADGPQAEAGHNPTPHQRRRTSVTHRRPSGDKPSPQRPRLEEWRRHRSGPGKVAGSLQSRTREPTTGKGVSHGALRNAAATDPSPRLAASPLDRHKPGCTGTHSVTRSTSTRRHNIAGHNSDRRKHGELCRTEPAPCAEQACGSRALIPTNGIPRTGPACQRGARFLVFRFVPPSSSRSPLSSAPAERQGRREWSPTPLSAGSGTGSPRPGARRSGNGIGDDPRSRTRRVGTEKDSEQGPDDNDPCGWPRADSSRSNARDFEFGFAGSGRMAWPSQTKARVPGAHAGTRPRLRPGIG